MNVLICENVKKEIAYVNKRMKDEKKILKIWRFGQ